MLALYLAMIDAPEEKTKFTQVYENYRNLMFHVAEGILKDTLLSEDAVQEALLRIAKNVEKIEDVDSPATKRFVTIVTENTAKNMYLKEVSRGEREELNESDYFKSDYFRGEDIRTGVDDVFDTVFDDVRSKELVKEILKLPEVQRKILYLQGVYGYRLAEIANLLDMKEATVRKYAQRARETVKELQKNDE